MSAAVGLGCTKGLVNNAEARARCWRGRTFVKYDDGRHRTKPMRLDDPGRMQGLTSLILWHAVPRTDYYKDPWRAASILCKLTWDLDITTQDVEWFESWYWKSGERRWLTLT